MFLHAKRGIDKYCELKKANALTSLSKCHPALPLSKINGLNTSTNNSAMSCRMRYAETVRINGTTMSSSSSPQKTCRIGGPTFSY